MITLDLTIDDCKNEMNLLNLTSRQFINKIYKEILLVSRNQCFGCGYQIKQGQKLKLHIIDFDESAPETTAKGIVLCDACYTIKHICPAIEKEQFILVNSIYSQKELIEKQRDSNKMTSCLLQKRKAIRLKKEPAEYWEAIQKNKNNLNPKIKVLFGKNFNWDNCK